jgi:hypothetical protein
LSAKKTDLLLKIPRSVLTVLAGVECESGAGHFDEAQNIRIRAFIFSWGRICSRS